MIFSVTAIDANGARRSFQREASDASTLRTTLKSEGLVIIGVVPQDASPSTHRSSRPTHHSSLSTHHFFTNNFSIEMGLRQIAAMLRSGVPLLVALDTVAEQSQGKSIRRIWRAIATGIENGDSLTAAMTGYMNNFGEIAVRLAEVGEKTGELARTLSRAADQMEARRNLRTMVVNALSYPILAVMMAIAVSAYLVISVIPKLADFLRTGGVALPTMTQMLMDFSDYMRVNGVALTVWIFAVAAAWIVLRCFDATREIQDAFLMRLPIVGRILRLSGTAMFSRSMQIMTESGVTLIDALETSAKLLSNRRLRKRANDALSAVVRGQTLDAALKPAKEFMPMMRPMAAVGEVSGSLPDAFAETARFHEMLLALAVKRFGMLIEPVMIIITGAIVGFVYIAFFVALFAIAGTR